MGVFVRLETSGRCDSVLVYNTIYTERIFKTSFWQKVFKLYRNISYVGAMMSQCVTEGSCVFPLVPWCPLCLCKSWCPLCLCKSWCPLCLCKSWRPLCFCKSWCPLCLCKCWCPLCFCVLANLGLPLCSLVSLTLDMPVFSTPLFVNPYFCGCLLLVGLAVVKREILGRISDAMPECVGFHVTPRPLPQRKPSGRNEAENFHNSWLIFSLSLKAIVRKSLFSVNTKSFSG